MAISANDIRTTLRKKIYWVSSNLVIGWSGSLLIATKILKSLDRFNNRLVSKAEFTKFLETYGPDTSSGLQAVFIGWIVHRRGRPRPSVGPAETTPDLPWRAEFDVARSSCSSEPLSGLSGRTTPSGRARWARPSSTQVAAGCRWPSLAGLSARPYGGGCTAADGSVEMPSPSPTAIRSAPSAVRGTTSCCSRQARLLWRP